MKLRTVLGAAVGSIGATAVANRVLQSRATDFEPFLDGDQGSYRWRGFDIAYTELGDPENDDILLLHGISAVASNHEFAGIVEDLRDEYHIIAPDLPGFGHSDRPPLLYSDSLYTTFVADVIEDLTDDAPIVIGSSLTSAYIANAGDQVEMDRLVLICPTNSTVEHRKVWLRSLLRSPIVGDGLFNVLTSKAGIRYFHEDHGYFDSTTLSEKIVDYEWQTAHQPGARFAPASFVSGFLDSERDLGETLAALDMPVTFVWGRDAELPPLSTGREIAERADAGLVVFDRAKLLPHMEHPTEFVDVVRNEVTIEQ